MAIKEDERGAVGLNLIWKDGETNAKFLYLIAVFDYFNICLFNVFQKKIYAVELFCRYFFEKKNGSERFKLERFWLALSACKISSKLDWDRLKFQNKLRTRNN